jgi:rubredoxin
MSDKTKCTCDACGYVYDPSEGHPAKGFPAGTSFTDLPDDWICPDCGAGKDLFSPDDE